MKWFCFNKITNKSLVTSKRKYTEQIHGDVVWKICSYLSRIYFQNKCWIKDFYLWRVDVGHVLNHYKLLLVHFSRLFILLKKPPLETLFSSSLLSWWTMQEKKNTKKQKRWHCKDIEKVRENYTCHKAAFTKTDKLFVYTLSKWLNQHKKITYNSYVF